MLMFIAAKTQKIDTFKISKILLISFFAFLKSFSVWR